jgi:hypothetical protein
MPTADDSGSCTVTTGTSTYIIETPLLFGFQEKPARGKFSARISLCDNVRRQPVPTHCGNHGTIQVFESRGKGDGQCWIFRQSNTNQQLGHVQPTEYADQISIPRGKTYCCSGTDKPWPELIDIKLKMHKSCESKGSTVHTIRPTTDYSVLHRCTSEDELVFEADVCYTYTTQNITAISSSASDSKGLSSGQIIGICVCVVSGIVVSVVVMGLVSGKSCFNAPTDREETTPLTGNNTSRTSRSVPAEGHRDSSTTYSSNSDTRNAVHRQQAEDESSNEDADNSQANAASISERAEGDRDRVAMKMLQIILRLMLPRYLNALKEIVTGRQPTVRILMILIFRLTTSAGRQKTTSISLQEKVMVKKADLIYQMVLRIINLWSFLFQEEGNYKVLRIKVVTTTTHEKND